MPEERSCVKPSPESLVVSMSTTEIIELLSELGIAVDARDAAVFRRVVATSGSIEQAFLQVDDSTRQRRAA